MNTSPIVQRMLLRIVSSVTKELFGEERAPRDKDETRAVADKIKFVNDHFGLMRFDRVPYPKRDWFLYARAPIKLMLGSNQSAKTTTTLADILSWCLGEYIWSGEKVLDLMGNPVKPPVRVLIGAESFTNAHAEVILPKLNELIPMDYLGIETDKMQGRLPHRIRFPKDLGGSSIKLMSYTQEPSDWEGHTWHRIAFDEPPPEFAFIATQRGAMRHRAITSFSMTPLKEPWIYDKLYANEDAIHIASEADLRRLNTKSIAVVNVSLDDTPYLSREAKDAFISKLDEEEKEARQFGRFKHLMGRVYKTFDRGIHVLPGSWKWDEKWPSGIVVDPHDRKPWAMMYFVVTPRDEIVFIAEWPDFDFQATKQWHWTVDQYVEKMREMEAELGLKHIIWELMDPNFGRAQKVGTATTICDELLNRGRYFDPKIDDDIPSGHIAVRDALANPARIFWTENCINGIKAMEHYTWSDYRVNDGRIKETPKDQWKDFCDLARYVVKFPVNYIEPGMVPAGTGGRNWLG